MRADAKLCACKRNENGDTRCHKCFEYVNVLCWNCRTPRGGGKCPTSPIEPTSLTHADQIRRAAGK